MLKIFICINVNEIYYFFVFDFGNFSEQNTFFVCKINFSSYNHYDQRGNSFLKI